MRNVLMLTLLLSGLTSCNEDHNEPNLEEKPRGGGQAVPVYNQAYQENYERDDIETILSDARDSYVLVDPFEDGVAAQISAIQAAGNEVGAYISIGTGEDWREDFQALEPYLVKKQWGQWEGEYFVNESNTGILEIMKARIDRIAAIGCDWVEFDNMDWVYDDEYRAEYGISATIEEGKAYFQALCEHVHAKGMKCMAKNMTDGAQDFDGVLYESYSDEKNWWDTDGTRSFLAAGKLVIINHYNESNCNQVYADYLELYGDGLSHICEDRNLRRYVHYNE